MDSSPSNPVSGESIEWAELREWQDILDEIQTTLDGKPPGGGLVLEKERAQDTIVKQNEFLESHREDARKEIEKALQRIDKRSSDLAGKGYGTS